MYISTWNAVRQNHIWMSLLGWFYIHFHECENVSQYKLTPAQCAHFCMISCKQRLKEASNMDLKLAFDEKSFRQKAIFSPCFGVHIISSSVSVISIQTKNLNRLYCQFSFCFLISPSLRFFQGWILSAGPTNNPKPQETLAAIIPT